MNDDIPFADIDGYTEASIFYKWLDDLEQSSIPNDAELDELRTRFGHEPFLHLIRRAEYISEKENIRNGIIPNLLYLSYLQSDLSQINSILLAIIESFKQSGIYIRRYDPNVAGVSILYRCRVLADLLISPHGFLQKKFESSDYEGYLKAIALLYELQDKITFELDDLNINEIKKRSEESLSFIGSKLIEVFEDGLKTSVDIAKSTGNFAGEFIGSAAGSFFSKISSYIWPLLLIGFLWKMFPAVKKNPPNHYEELWKHTRGLDGTIKEIEFKDGLKMFFAQHGRYPEKNEIVRVKDHAGVNLAVMIGKVKDVTYNPPSGKKSPYLYKHEMPNSLLVTDVSGRNIFFVGDTYMDRSDGWLKK